jgi:hypothetical protein
VTSSRYEVGAYLFLERDGERQQQRHSHHHPSTMASSMYSDNPRMGHILICIQHAKSACNRVYGELSKTINTPIFLPTEQSTGDARSKRWTSVSRLPLQLHRLLSGEVQGEVSIWPLSHPLGQRPDHEVNLPLRLPRTSLPSQPQHTVHLMRIYPRNGGS